MVLYLYLQKFLVDLFCIYVKSCKLDFGQSILTCFCP
jgi:hypothetical protein